MEGICASLILVISGGCSTPEQTAGLIVGSTLLGAQAPTQEIEQIYYLGVFDPQEQVPESVYRVRVRGQTSFISFVRFASGWVRSDLVDSLGTNVGFDPDKGVVTITKSSDVPVPSLQTGRRLMVFGPEGFREAPRDHRLVIVMGGSPEKFFQAVDEALGTVAEVQKEALDSKTSQILFAELERVQSERARLDDFRADLQGERKAEASLRKAKR